MSDYFDVRLAETTLIPNLEVDHYKRFNRETGMFEAVSVAATDEEQRASHEAALRRELEGVDYRLAHLDDEPASWQQPPLPQEVERARTGLVNTRAAIVAELGEEPVAKPRRRK